MLANNHSFRKLPLLGGKRSKVEPITTTTAPFNGNVSIDDLAFLVKRLSVQIDDLETWKEKESTSKQQTSEQQPLPPLPQQETQQQHPSTHTKRDTKRPPTHTTIDPWASYVPQNYGALLQRLEDIESLQKCPNECCASTGTVSSADGVPWPNPIEPFQTIHTNNASSFMGSSQQSLNEMLDTQYTHWCTLMRCLPLMDPVTCAHVKTVGLYAMREILKTKANQKRDFFDQHPIQQQTCCSSTMATTTKLRESLSCLSDQGTHAVVPLSGITPANQDMPAWMSTSETKTAIADIAPTPPAVPPKETETTTTPTPSGFPSPTLLNRKRFHKWVKYKKSQRKAHTDTASTPMGQSQTLRKIGSWFF
ncbi:unnamed protein product [Mucor fragilis]